MDYDTYDMKAEAKAYYADKAAESELARSEAIEVARLIWAQTHGNDSGFDPYAGIYED